MVVELSFHADNIYLTQPWFLIWEPTGAATTHNIKQKDDVNKNVTLKFVIKKDLKHVKITKRKLISKQISHKSTSFRSQNGSFDLNTNGPVEEF